MKVLYIATSFPEPEKGATIYTDLAEALNEAGHELTVAVSEQPGNITHTKIEQERGFDVLRIVTGNYYDVNLLEKGVTTLKIPILMRRGISKYIGNREFDFILFEAPPVTNANLVAWAKKKFNCPAYLMLKDIFPQNAVDLEMIKKDGILHKYFSFKEKHLYRIADFIGCMSTANKNYILSHNPWLDSKKIEIFPNTKKIIDNVSKENKFPLRDRYSIPKETCVFLFGGNMGKPQYVDILCEAIKYYKDDNKVFFLFVGRGTEKYKLEETIETYRIKNALVIGNLPRDEYEQITKEADVGLIVLDPRFTIPNYPSRILSYMEFGKPVLAVTDKQSDLKNIVEKGDFGEWAFSGDFESFIKKINDMTSNIDLKEKGNNAREYMLEHFNVQRSVSILEAHFNYQRSKTYVQK